MSLTPLLKMICLLPVGRICNLIWSSPEVLQFSKPTKIRVYARDCRPVKISYFRLCLTVKEKVKSSNCFCVGWQL